MSWNEEYNALKNEIQGKFKSLKDYKDYARSNKDLKWPVSPDLYFKKRGMEVWNAKDFLGEFDESLAPVSEEEPSTEEKVEMELPTVEEVVEEPVSEPVDEEMAEEVAEEVREMEEMIEDTSKPVPHVSHPKPTPAPAKTRLLAEGDLILDTVPFNELRAKLKTQYLHNAAFTEVTDNFIVEEDGPIKSVFITQVRNFCNMVFQPCGTEFSIINEGDGKYSIAFMVEEKDGGIIQELLNRILTSKYTGKNVFDYCKDDSVQKEEYIMGKGNCFVYA